MSTLPSVVSRFVEYYAALDSQPPSALVGLYHSNATLIDPFGEHDGIFRASALLHPSAGQRRALPFFHRYAAMQREPVCCDLGNALVASAHCRGESRSNCRDVRWWTRKAISSRHQRDYYDAGEMIYEHLPLLGWAVRGVKRRVKS
ncbi:Uncharacterised protein [Enterobacter asburiae]|uniref:Nuclear transport factor 2 family protein n=1 Tax=Enterobacter asburiae TaxID=61645 RepID=A0A376F8B6_ENTAS|nr:Uncharacterised protein [Enterobacter asburiae]